MKIAHVISTFLPHIGGMGNVCFEEISRIGIDNSVSVFTIKYSKVKYNKIDEQNNLFKVFRIKPFIKIGDAGIMTGLKNKLKEYDVVHFHYPFYGAISQVLNAKKEFGFKLIVTYHMDAQLTGFKKVAGFFYDFFFVKKLLLAADKILAVDKDYLESSKFVKHCSNKVSILPNGVDIENFKPGKSNLEIIKQYNLEGKKIILFVGNLLLIKKLDTLLDAMQKLDNNTVLLVVGGGYLEQKFKDIARDLRIEDRVFFLGKIHNQNKLADLYRIASVVAVPSISESFSLVALEAMACGTLILVSNIEGVASRVIDGIDGFVVLQNTVEQWVNSLSNILSLSIEDSSVIRKKAKDKAVQYDWGIHCKKLKNIYEL